MIKLFEEENDMERRKRRGLREWEEILCEQAQSGMTAAAFCRRADIGVSSFYHWKQRLGKGKSGAGGGQEGGGSFIDMGRLGGSGVSAAGGESSWVVTLDFGNGLKLTLHNGGG